MVLSVHSATASSRERSLRAHSGVLQNAAPVSSQMHVATNLAQTTGLKENHGVSFNDMLNSSRQALEVSPISATNAISSHMNSKDGNNFALVSNVTNVDGDKEVDDTSNVGSSVVSGDKSDAVVATKEKLQDLEQYLTEQDRAFIDKVNMPDEFKATLKYEIALDRKSGELDGPLTPYYIYGEGGLLNRNGDILKNYLLEDSDTESMLDIMKRLQSFSNDMMDALSYSDEAMKNDPNMYVSNVDDKIVHVDLNSRIRMEANYNLKNKWVNDTYGKLQEDGDFQDKLTHPENRLDTKGGILNAKVEEEATAPATAKA